jgi:hypothetical protein
MEEGMQVVHGILAVNPKGVQKLPDQGSSEMGRMEQPLDQMVPLVQTNE